MTDVRRIGCIGGVKGEVYEYNSEVHMKDLRLRRAMLPVPNQRDTDEEREWRKRGCGARGGLLLARKWGYLILSQDAVVHTVFLSTAA